MFNALKYTRNLEENGFEREQAELLVRMFMQMIEFNMLSKSDFENFQSTVYHRFEKIDNNFENIERNFQGIEHKFKALEKRIDERLEYQINKISLQLTVKLGVMLAISIGLISTILAIKL